MWIFVGGLPRSGTTLARGLLNLHPRCFLYNETRFTTTLYESLSRPPSPPNYFSYNVGGEKRLLFMGMMSFCHERKEIVRAMCDGLFVLHPNRTHLGDKHPLYSEEWPLLRECFPDCKIVFCDRDFEATLASFLRQEWCDLDEPVAREYLSRLRAAQEGCADSFRLKLESLEADPDREIATLLEYVGLSLDEYDTSSARELVTRGNLNRSSRPMKDHDRPPTTPHEVVSNPAASCPPATP